MFSFQPSWIEYSPRLEALNVFGFNTLSNKKHTISRICHYWHDHQPYSTHTLPIFCNKFTQISISANCLAIVARTTNPLTCLLVFRCSQPQPKSKLVSQKGFGRMCGLKRGMICLDFKINLGGTYFISHDQAVLAILLFNTRDIWPALVSEHRTMLHILSEGQKGRTQRPRGILNAIKKYVCIHTHNGPQHKSSKCIA